MSSLATGAAADEWGPLAKIPMVNERNALPLATPAPEVTERACRAWLAAIARRDEAALSAFYDATVNRVYGLALRITRQPESAAEVVSDVYFQVWRDAGRYDAACPWAASRPTSGRRWHECEGTHMKRKTRRGEVLDRKVLQELLLATAPLAPAPVEAAGIKRRIMEKVRNEGSARSDACVTVRSDAGTWMNLLPRVQVKVLHSDGRYNSILLRMGPGSSLPAHFHEDDEECVVLEGQVRIGDVGVSAGDYHLAPSGSRHGELRSDTGAVLFLRTTKTIAPFSRRSGA